MSKYNVEYGQDDSPKGPLFVSLGTERFDDEESLIDHLKTYIPIQNPAELSELLFSGEHQRTLTFGSSTVIRIHRLP